MWVQSLGQEAPLEEGKATHSSVLAWRIPMDRGDWQATVHRVTKSWTRLKRLSTHTCIQRALKWLKGIVFLIKFIIIII